MNNINTRADLDSASPETKAIFMSALAGTIYRLEKDDELKSWKATTDTTTIERFGFTLSDFPDAVAPELPVYVPQPNPRIAEIQQRLTQIDQEAIRAMRSKQLARGKPADDVKLTALDDEADALRVELATL